VCFVCVNGGIVMKDSAEKYSDIVLCTVCFLIGVFIAVSSPTYELGYYAKDKIEQCEQSLPRNEHCKIIAVKE